MKNFFLSFLLFSAALFDGFLGGLGAIIEDKTISDGIPLEVLGKLGQYDRPELQEFIV